MLEAGPVGRPIRRATRCTPCQNPAVLQDAVDRLIALLDLEPIEVNMFRGVSPDETVQRVFGGQVAGQALVAAARGHRVHSLHAYFLRTGDPAVPILYEVDRIRDGRSFTTRRVIAIQHGKAIFNLQASFHVPEQGLDHQVPMADVTAPELLPTFTERWAPWAAGAPALPARVAEGRRCAPRRPRAPRLRAGLRVRHDAPRHRAPPPRR